MSAKVEMYTVHIRQLVKDLDSDVRQGLDPGDRAKRLKRDGTNTLPDRAPVSLLQDIWEQVSNPIVIILLVAISLSFWVGHHFEAILIGGIVSMMAGVGIFLERQSRKSLAELSSLQTPVSSILTEGKSIQVPSKTLVKGDIVFLHEGDLVPADARVIESDQLQTDEAALTGESMPAEKTAATLSQHTALAEQHNMVFAGTSVVGGKAKVIVTATASNTEVGKIATYLNQAEPELTPLQQELALVGQFLLMITGIMSGAISLLYLYRGETVMDTLLLTTSLAVAFVPEGLTAVMTTTLALAVADMVKKKVIVKRLIAAEGLGSVTHLATDKTGTMTEGRMQVVSVFINNRVYDVMSPALKKEKGYQRLIDVIRFCTNNKGPTEQALVAFLSEHGFSYELEGREVEYRFTSDLKRMSVVRRHQDQLRLFSKGAPDVLIPLCSHHLVARSARFTQAEKEVALKKAAHLARQGFRVLALADKVHTGPTTQKHREESESELCFIGLVALMDPLRSTVEATVTGFRRAGIMPLMITGDHPAIARYVAEQAGLIKPGQNELVLTGTDLDEVLVQSLDPDNRELLLKTKVFARVRPEHKVMLVDFLQDQGYRIAMTGDGVNDAAALKKSNIGIAMSNGSSLTKDIADVVITGSYDALLRAVSLGRTVIMRTRLYLHYLLSGNASEVGIFIVAVIADWPTPFTPAALLLINVLTDALPALALAVEKEDPELLKQKPIQHKSLLNGQVLRGIGIQAVISIALMALVFWRSMPYGLELARGIVFTLFVFKETLRGFTARSLQKSVVEYGFLSNRWMLAAQVLVIVIWAGAVYGIPSWFGLAAVPLYLLPRLMLLALIMPLVEESTKWFNRRRKS